MPDKGLNGGILCLQGERQRGDPAQQRREGEGLRQRRGTPPYRRGRAQLAVHLGSRFPMKALGPSLASFVLVTRRR